MEVTLALREQRHTAAARETWRTLLARVQNFPFALPQHGLGIDARYTGCGWRPEAIADTTILRARPTLLETARFCLSNAFFDKQLDARVAILLHEAIHVRLFTGRLAANYAVIEHTRQPDANAMDDFARWQWKIATDALVFVQEVGADKYMRHAHQAQWPEYLAERSVTFYRPSVPADGDGVPTELRSYRALNQLMRAELGLSMITDQAMLADVTQRRDAIQVLLGGLDDDERLRLLAIKDVLLDVTVTIDDLDPDSYRELFDEILQVVPNEEVEG